MKSDREACASPGARTVYIGALAFLNCVLACAPVTAPDEETGTRQQAATTFDRPTLDVVDTNPDPNVFEAALAVDEQDVLMEGRTVHTIIYKDTNSPAAYTGTPNGFPVPQIVVDVGDEVIVTLTNDLEADCAAVECNTSIHWHGTELDNDSDGTGVTQNRVAPGETYTYRFFAPRPGVFWFHPHMMPGGQVFAGAYGALIVRDPNEPALQANGTIPPEGNTHTLVLSDTEFDADGDVGYIDPDTSEAVPWQTLAEECGATGATCTVLADGQTVLVNGQSTADGVPLIKARSGAGVRLRLVNTSTNRYFLLHVDGNGSDNNLYRIGGEGGFLDTARLEGGLLGSWDSKYAPGEILVTASGRADVVIVPTGSDGDLITISGAPYERKGPSDLNPAGDLLQIQIDNSLADGPYDLAHGDPIVGPGGVEDLKGVTITDFYLDPVPALPGPGSGAGSSSDIMVLEGKSPGVTAIDGVAGHYEDSGPDYTQVPYQGATRYALTGDMLEFTIQNVTNQHHPFHHHGFSFQPVRLIDDTSSTVVYEFDYAEFVDVIDVPHKHSMVVRMRLDDRPRITDTRQEASAPAPDQFFASGGAAGRWVLHCHLFVHAAVGMISELVVLDTDRDGDGFDTSVDCNDSDPAIPAPVEICDDGVDNDCSGHIDEAGCNHYPEANAGEDMAVECAAAGGSLVMLDATASSDEDGDALLYSWSAPGVVFDDPTSATATGFFPLGTTTVTLTVSDGFLEDTDEVEVTVVDTVAPELAISIDPQTLWPPNHKYVDLSASVQVTDVCDPGATFVLTSISSDEPDDGTADGATTNDILNAETGTADVSFQLRAERSARGDGRTYTIAYTATDASGNTTSDSVDIGVAVHP